MWTIITIGLLIAGIILLMIIFGLGELVFSILGALLSIFTGGKGGGSSGGGSGGGFGGGSSGGGGSNSDW